MNDQQQLQDFLEKIQLIQYYRPLVEILHLTKIEHFEHVIETDLQNIGMSMPEIRRLFDQIRKNKRKFFISKLKKSFRKSCEEPVDFSFNGTTQNLLTSPKNKAKCLIQLKDIKFIEVIGKGAFGSVRSAEWTIQDNEKVLVAVKCIRQTNCNKIEDVQSEVLKEANAMSYLNHPNLIRFFGVLISSPMMLVTELAPLGTLLKKLRQESNKFQISTLCSFIVQIAAGMKYLEKNKIVHRDLAARNILLMSYEKIKIGDFGLARPLDHETDHYVMNPDGLIPFAWCAPECLKFKRFSHASDVWAFGITACELFTYGEEPWAGLNGAQILEKIHEPNNERPPCPDFCPREIYSILRNHCWNYEENNRAEFDDLEKLLLSVLPSELKAETSLTSINDDMLRFSPGDIITVFNTNSMDGIWKGQNRSTGQVGYLSSTYVDFSNGTISTGNVQPKKIDSSHDDKLEARSQPPPGGGFTNKLWNIWDSEPESFVNDLTSKPQSLSSKLFKDYEGTNSVGSGFGPSSSMGSYCEECSFQNSVDSGCLCRCSTFSSDSSTQRYSTDNNSLSKPISIPGNRASFLHHTSASERRCSSCNSNRLSVFSDTLDRDLFDNSPLSSSPAQGQDTEVLSKSISSLKIRTTQKAKQNKLSTSEGTKQSSSLSFRRRSLPDLANTRKRNLLGRSLRLRKRKELTSSVVKSKDDISAPVSNRAKFYLPGQDAVISDAVSSSLESYPLYDLVPIRDRSNEQVISPSNEAHYMQPRPLSSDHHDGTFTTSTPRSDDIKYDGSEKHSHDDIYENILDVTPKAPPRRKKNHKRHSMIEIGDNDVIQYGSPTTRQCIILDQKYETDYYSNISL